MIKKRVIFATGLAALAATAAVGIASAGRLFDPAPAQAAGAWVQLPYVAERRPNGNVRARVLANMERKTDRAAYIRQRQAEAMAVAQSGTGTGTGTVAVQVTFGRPMPLDEVRQLAKDTAFNADLLIFEARDRKNGLHTMVVRTRAPDLVDPSTLAPDLAARGLRLIGVAVAKGTVPATAAGLGRLAADRRVLLADVSAHLLKTEIAARYGVSADRVEISLPTPHWFLSAGQ